MRNNLPVSNQEYPLPDDCVILSRTDKKGIITDCNEEFVEASGFTREELIGKPHNIIRHPDMPSEAFRDVWSTLASGRPWIGIVKNRCKNGDFYWVRATATPLPDGSGYTSVRSKPTHAEVQGTEALYKRMREGEKIRLSDGRIQPNGIMHTFRKLRIAHRLLMMVGLPVLLSIILIANSLTALRVSSHALKSVYQDRLVALDQLAKINDLNQMSLLNLLLASRNIAQNINADDQLSEINNYKLEIDKQWTAYMATKLSEEEQVLASDSLTKRDKMWAVISKTASLLSAKDLIQAQRMFDVELAKVRMPQEDAIDKLANLQLTIGKYEYQTGDERYKLSLNISLILGSLGTLIALLVAGFSMRHITRSLSEASAAASTIANGDLTTPLPHAGNDEIGDVVAKIAIMRNSVFEIIANIRTNANLLTQSAGSLTASANDGARTAENQALSASSIAAAVEEMSASIEQVQENSHDAFDITRASTSQSDESGEIIHEAAAEMGRMAESVKSTALTIRELEEYSKQISSIANVIKEIAEQTNLLALNAAIEAARAGEQGRGFAVVADEVRKLAERTANSTTEITGMIDQIQEGTQRAAEEMEIGVARVSEGVQLAEKAGESMTSIRQSAEKASQSVNDISDALKEQVIAVHEITHRVEQISQDSEVNSELASNTANSAQQIQNLAQHLEKLSKRFKIA
ncbi:MAG: methyl-accepting chemotaxis protein [Gallionellaceae bacterium]